MEEQPISKPLILVAIIIVLIITIGAIFLVTNLTQRGESNVQAFTSSNEILQNILLARTAEAMNDIASSEASETQSSQAIIPSYGLKDLISYMKDSDNKFYSQKYSNSTYGQYNLLSYGYNFNNYGVFCYFPSNWENGSAVFNQTSTTYNVVRCSSDITSQEAPSLYLTEMDISNYQNHSTDQYLNLLENDVKKYQSDLGYGSVGNFSIENKTYNSSTKRVLSYDFSLSQYYNYEVWSTIELGGNYMYILTVSISKNELTEENKSNRDIIIHTFTGTQLNT